VTSKCLIIGDTHYDTKCSGYLDSQLKATLDIVEKNKPKYVVFLGDIFHHRKPTPEVIVGVHNLFKKLRLIPGITKIYVLRGNHDSQNRSDDGLTALEVLDYPGSKVKLVQHTYLDSELNMLFIPHYEDEDEIKRHLLSAPNSKTIAFGHFSYSPECFGLHGFESSLELKDFPCRTILGHIHKSLKDDKVTILGTPWSTNYGECDYDHYVGILNQTKTGWGALSKVKVEIGPRFYEAPYDSLDAMKEDIADGNYFTMLRVLINKFTEAPPNILRAEIENKFKVGHVDLKFKPVYHAELNNRLSNYDPGTPLTTIDGDVIKRYIEEQASTIPTERLEEGLNLIREHADTEDLG
jgi:DNA repair exonuclease SbcCD nuclease subunit